MGWTTIRRIHAAASSIALALVAGFFVATLTVETAGDDGAIAAVKGWIVRLLVILVLAMAAAGLTGRRLAGRSRNRVVRRKQSRMIAIAAIGLGVLVPCAIVLDRMAARGGIGGPMFAVVQGIELAGGAANLFLLGRNLQAGLALRARRRRPRTRVKGSVRGVA